MIDPPQAANPGRHSRGTSAAAPERQGRELAKWVRSTAAEVFRPSRFLGLTPDGVNPPGPLDGCEEDPGGSLLALEGTAVAHAIAYARMMSVAVNGVSERLRGFGTEPCVTRAPHARADPQLSAFAAHSMADRTHWLAACSAGGADHR